MQQSNAGAVTKVRVIKAVDLEYIVEAWDRIASNRRGRDVDKEICS